MGGKSKQSQRTKNNVRPSSSSRSAEHLSGGLSLDGGLMSLTAGKPLPPLFPTLAAANLEQGLNPEFQMCIKKLNKKDPITRAKALHELCELVKNGDVEDVVAVLPSWAHYYKILTVDTDRKVREVTQACHGALVRACGRRVAPQLKALLPAWLQAQHDEHAPAQSHAQHSLASTFPDSKLPEVISFCKAEVMAHLLDNLNGNTEAIVCKRIEKAEERELVMNRITTSSLQGLQYFCAHLPPAHDDWLWGQLTALLQAKHYWRHAHAAPPLRAAWLGALGGVSQRFGAALGALCGARVLRVLLSCAGERAADAALWTCLLLLMQNVPDWHTYLDKKDLLVKRILDVLENGGWGDARHLSNILLPLLAYLPQDMLTKEFYEAFFNAVLSGLEKKNILNSKSERQSWISSLSECLRYLSIQPHEFVPEVLGSVQRAWLARVLPAPRDTPQHAPQHAPHDTPQHAPHDALAATHLLKCSATNMAALVKYWLKQSKEENGEKYDQLVRNFWQTVGSTVVTQIDKSSTDHNEIAKLIESHILLLQTLKTAFSQDVKKQHSIKFDGDEQTAPETSAAAGRMPRASDDASVVERYRHNLDDVVHNICSHYVDSAEKKQVASAILTPLITLLVEFDSKQLFSALARQFGADSAYQLYDRVLRGWLAGDTMRCRALVDILFLMMKYMTEEEQDAMFDTFQQFPPVAVEWCLSVCVRHPHVRLRAVRRWMRGDVVRAALRALCGRAALHAGSAALLCACLTDEPTGELLVSAGSVSDVVSAAVDALVSPGGAALEQRAGLAARVATALHERGACADLLLQLFRLNMLVPRGDQRMSLDTWSEVRSSWQDGAAALPAQERAHFLRRVADLMHEEVLHNTENLDITKIENIASLCPHLFNRCDYAEAPEDVSEIVAFTKLIVSAQESHSAPHSAEVCALRRECVTAALSCPLPGDDAALACVVRDAARHDVKELTKSDLLSYVNKYLFRAIFLRSLLLHRINSVDDEDEPSEQRTWCDVLLKHEYFQTELCNVLYTYMVINSLHEGYAFWPHYDVIVETEQKLSSLLMGVLSAAQVRAVRGTLAARGRARGALWARALRWYELHAPGDQQEDILEEHQLEDIVSGNGYFHTLQASTKWSSDACDACDAYDVQYVVMLRSWHAAHGLGGELLRDVTRGRGGQRDVTHDLDVIVDAYYKHNHTMLYDKNISECAWSEVVSNVAVVEFLTAMVTSRGWDAPAHHWDFTTITLCSLLTSVRKSMDSWGSTKVSMLARATLRLWRGVRGFVHVMPAECTRRTPSAHVAELATEWKDIFHPDTAYNLFSLVMHVLESCDESEITSTHIEVLAELIPCTRLLEWNALAGAHQHDALSLARLTHCALHALRRPAHHAHAQLAHALLHALAEPLVLHDAEKLKQWSEDSQEDEEDKQRPQFCLDQFHDSFTHLHELVSAALSSVELGEGTCEVVAMSDTYNVCLGWLLLGDVLAALCRLARGDLEHHYIQIYRQRGYAEPLVTCCLRLLPLEVLTFATSPSQAAGPAPPSFERLFLGIQDYSVHEPARGAHISALACRTLYLVLTGAGAAGARGWWGAAPPRPARLLERVVRAYVAPHAARHQLRRLQQRAKELPDTEIHISWSSNEVTCVYNVEERLIELHVWLSPAHPLVPPRLAAPHAQGPGANTQWVALYLSYQNGTLLNALKMWTLAVSSRVESSPQCYICYCRLHPADGRLPRVLCYQCKNKFHTTCLRKWFSTSNKSNCPLCRSAF